MKKSSPGGGTDWQKARGPPRSSQKSLPGRGVLHIYSKECPMKIDMSIEEQLVFAVVIPTENGNGSGGLQFPRDAKT